MMNWSWSFVYPEWWWPLLVVHPQYILTIAKVETQWLGKYWHDMDMKGRDLVDCPTQLTLIFMILCFYLSLVFHDKYMTKTAGKSANSIHNCSQLLTALNIHNSSQVHIAENGLRLNWNWSSADCSWVKYVHRQCSFCKKQWASRRNHFCSHSSWTHCNAWWIWNHNWLHSLLLTSKAHPQPQFIAP